MKLQLFIIACTVVYSCSTFYQLYQPSLASDGKCFDFAEIPEGEKYIPR